MTDVQLAQLQAAGVSKTVVVITAVVVTAVVAIQDILQVIAQRGAIAAYIVVVTIAVLVTTIV